MSNAVIVDGIKAENKRKLKPFIGKWLFTRDLGYGKLREGNNGFVFDIHNGESYRVHFVLIATAHAFRADVAQKVRNFEIRVGIPNG